MFQGRIEARASAFGKSSTKRGFEEQYRLQLDCYDDDIAVDALADKVEQALVDATDTLEKAYDIHNLRKIADIDSAARPDAEHRGPRDHGLHILHAPRVDHIMPAWGIQIRQDTLTPRLIGFTDRMRTGIGDRLMVLGDEMVNIARGIVPVRTGFLRDSIFAELVESDLALTFGATAPYADFVEFGTYQDAGPAVSSSGARLPARTES